MFSAESSTHAVAGVHETGGIIIMHYANCSEIPLEKEVATPPVFLPGESPGQRSLVGYSPWSCKESDMTE